MLLLMDLCEEVVKMPGTMVSKQRQEHDRLDLEGARATEQTDVGGVTR